MNPYMMIQRYLGSVRPHAVKQKTQARQQELDALWLKRQADEARRQAEKRLLRKHGC
jgi:hypothetical protein